MKDLSNLSPAKGSHRSRKRLGRGPGSGHGKTAGKGHKGQRARKGGGIPAGFEGGQTPLYRRLPKVGFTNPFPNEYSIISLKDLNVFNDGDLVTAETLVKNGLLRKKNDLVKVLANGELTKKITLKVHKLSSGAKAAVERVGGTIEEI
jgi:large subunit ribosomal protein L15